MSDISIDDVKKLARLASLSVDEQEAKKLQSQLDSIIGFFDVLDAVDTSQLEPTAQVTGLVNVTREDTIVDYGVSKADLLDCAPATENGYIKVKRVLDNA